MPGEALTSFSFRVEARDGDAAALAVRLVEAVRE